MSLCLAVAAKHIQSLRSSFYLIRATKQGTCAFFDFNQLRMNYEFFRVDSIISLYTLRDFEVILLGKEPSLDIQRLMSAFDRLAKAEWRKQPLLGIKNSEVRTLLCIKNLAREGDKAITVSEISHRMFVKSPTVTQIVNHLQKDGYIARTNDAKDKRFVYISLTEKGERIVQKVNNYLTILFSGLIEKLGQEQSENLMFLLDEVIDYLDEAHIDLD